MLFAFYLDYNKALILNTFGTVYFIAYDHSCAKKTDFIQLCAESEVYFDGICQI